MVNKVTRGNPEEEYKDVSSNIRHYGSTRFVLLTLFSSLSAPLIAALFLSSNMVEPPTKMILKILGLVLVVAFAVMYERASEYWSNFWKRAVELETKLDYAQYRTRPRRMVISITSAVRLLYLSILAFWVITLIKPDWF